MVHEAKASSHEDLAVRKEDQGMTGRYWRRSFDDRSTKDLLRKQEVFLLPYLWQKEEKMKKHLALAAPFLLTAALLMGCGSGNTAANKTASSAASTAEASSEALSRAESGAALKDGTYSAEFSTDSKMFHVNDAYDGKGTLTVKDGQMTIHVSLTSKNIVNLFPGTAADAQKEGAVLLQPTSDTVSFDDGTTEEVNGFDVPVPAINQEFDLALLGTKGKWYDHKASVKNPVEDSAEGKGAASDAAKAEGAASSISSDPDQAADHVAALIDSIYVQEKTDQTEDQCREAKLSWDALTDEQKKLVRGQYADPDYFGLDTGDASKDDPLNGDEIGEKELLVVSFGTSFNDSRAEDVGGVEKALQAAYPDWSVRRAFTSQIIINHVLARDGEAIDNMDEALKRAVDNGVKDLVIQPTHLMHGSEYDELNETLAAYKDKFRSAKVAEPLLGKVGKDISEINADKEAVAKAVVAQAVTDAGYEDLTAAAADGTAFVLMGHGTSHEASISYNQMQTAMDNLAYKNVFVGTVEGKPADTAVDTVIEKVKAAGYKKVVLRPLMVVAGDHANNDMAGDAENSWKSKFTAAQVFDQVEPQIAGMGRMPEIQKIYADHVKAAIG